MPPRLLERVAAGEAGPEAELLSEGGSPRLRFPRSATRPFPEAMTDLEGRLAHMDALGVDLQLLSFWAEAYGYDLPRPAAIRYHAAANEELARAAASRPERFRWLATVPLPWAEAAAREAERAAAMGAAGVMVGTQVDGRELDAGELEPFWAAAEALGLAVMIHPALGQAPRLGRYYLNNLLGNRCSDHRNLFRAPACHQAGAPVLRAHAPPASRFIGVSPEIPGLTSPPRAFIVSGPLPATAATRAARFRAAFSSRSSTRPHASQR